MSKKIKTVYDANPTAGDDLSKEALFAGDDGTGTPVVYDRTQVSNTIATVGEVKTISERVGALETETVPDPDTAFWNVTIQDNTLIANVFVSAYTGDAWIIVKDSDTTPTDDSVGSTPPTGFTSGLYSNTYDMLLYKVGILYFYQWDEINGIVEKTAQDGTSGISVTPIWDKVPDWTNATELVLTPGTDPETQIKYIFGDPNLPTTEKTIVRYDLYEEKGGVSVKLVDGISATATPTDIIYTFVPGTVYTLLVRAIDNSIPALTSDGTPATITTDSAAAGTIAISAPPVVVEEGVDSDVIFSISATPSGDTLMHFQTLDQTLQSGTNYRHRGSITVTGELTRVGTTATIAHTDIGVEAGDTIIVSGVTGTANDIAFYNGTFTVASAADSDTLTYTMSGAPDTATATGTITCNTGVVLFPNGDGSDVTISIETIDNDEPANSVFETHLLPGTETNSAIMDESLLSAYAVLHKLDGTGTGSGYPESTSLTLAGVANKELFLLTLDHDHTIAAGTSGQSWTEDPIAHDVDDTANWKGGEAPTNVATATTNATFTSGVTDLTVEAGHISWAFNVSVAGNYSFWSRSYNHGTDSYGGHYLQADGGTPFNTLSPGSESDSYIKPSIAPTPLLSGNWGLAPTCTDALKTIFLDEGLHTVELYPVHDMTGMDFSGILIHNEPTYDPQAGAASPAFNTLDQSTAGTETAEDDPTNPSVPTGPVFPGTVTPTPTLTPANGADSVQISSIPTALFTGVTGMEVKSNALVVLSDGSPVSGATSTNGVDKLWFTPSSGAMPAGTSIVITLTAGSGSAVDTDGVRKSLAIGTWNFVMIETGVSGVLFYENNSTIPIGLANAAVLAPFYNVNDGAAFFTFGNEEIEVLVDEHGTFNRALSSTVPADQFAEGMQLRIKPSAQSATMHLYFKFFLPEILPVNKEFKIGGIFAYDENVQGADGNVVGNSDSTLGYSARMSVFGPGAIPSTTIPGGDNSNVLGIVLMTKEIQASGYTFGRTLLCKYPAQTTADGSGIPVGLAPGKWNSIELQVTRNTSAGSAAGSELKIWVNGYLGLDFANDIIWNDSVQNYTPNMTWADIYHGGGDSSFTSPEDRTYSIDEWTIKDSRIGTIDRSTPSTTGI